MEKICQLWGQARLYDNNEGVSFLYLRSLFMLNDVYCQTGEDKENGYTLW